MSSKKKLNDKMNFFQFVKRKMRSASNDESVEAAIMRKYHFTPMGQFDESDVFVCGWPKSGNTWCQRLFSGLVWGLDTSVLTDQLAQFLQPDVHYKPYYYRFGTPTLFKSHLPPQLDYRRVVFLVRDGRDALVSYWRMLKRDAPDLSLEELFDQGHELFPCAWEAHARQWLANPFRADLLTIRYEDLLGRPRAELRRVAAFIGVERSDEELDRIIAGADIAKMRRVAARHGWDNEGSPRGETFLGPGRAGTVRDVMPPTLQEAFRQRAGDMLEHFGYE